MSQESDLRDLHAQAVAAYQQGRPTFVARFKVGVWGLTAFPLFRRREPWTPQGRS